jgi:hypothetical protein
VSAVEDLEVRVLTLLAERQGESPGRGLSTLELSRALGVPVLDVTRCVFDLFFEGRVRLSGAGPNVVEALR